MTKLTGKTHSTTLEGGRAASLSGSARCWRRSRGPAVAGWANFDYSTPVHSVTLWSVFICHLSGVLLRSNNHRRPLLEVSNCPGLCNTNVIAKQYSIFPFTSFSALLQFLLPNIVATPLRYRSLNVKLPRLHEPKQFGGLSLMVVVSHLDCLNKSWEWFWSKLLPGG